MTTPVQEPEEISQEVFDGPVPEDTVWIRWDVINGPIREMHVPLNTGFTLKGAPQHDPRDTYPNGEPDLIVEGPTSGKVKVEPNRKIASWPKEDMIPHILANSR
ncbi:hypothetical protein MY11210_009480 [Beauveria gryllotalpidicola]